ncbi:MAG: Asp-tRNA(Asn)/Glu-tRNA(Gln) amidotransferase subunit GatC [Kiritimatiellae bacterium]|nr:Asp-tRNA(Asn)/Glu-tRNA(Gln) amidotransferase subunit GatC [Kiritimatiellia bacterium]
MSSSFNESAEHMDVEYVAQLARLHLTPEERTLYQRQLDQILGYVDELKAVDVEGVEPMAHPMPRTNVLRRDECGTRGDREAVLANAPSVRHHQFVVPKIVE